jgi:TonB family protein
MTPHLPSSTRLATPRASDALSLLDACARSRRRWAFTLALGLNVFVWKAIASLPQASSQTGSSSAVEWSRIEVYPLPPQGEILKLAAPAPKSPVNAAVQHGLSLVSPQVPRESQTWVARRTLSVPSLTPQRPALPQRTRPAAHEMPPVRHNPDLEPPPLQENRWEQNQPNAAPDVRSTQSQRATWITPSSNASSTKASEYDALPPAEQTPLSTGNAIPATKTSGADDASSTRSANMTVAPTASAINSSNAEQRSGTDFPADFRDGSSRNGTSSSGVEGKRGGARSEGGDPGGRSSSRMNAPDVRTRELPDLEPRPTPREEPRPVATPRPQQTPQPQETPRRAVERSQSMPAARNVEKPKRSTQVREAQADHIVKPRVPKRLRREKRRLSVGLDVDVDENGRATPRLRESSGDSELDEEALKAARKTRWKPRSEDGKATKSTQRMRYDVDVKDGAGSDDAGEEEE